MRHLSLLVSFLGLASCQLLPEYSLSDETIQIMAAASKPQTAAITPCIDVDWNFCQSKFNVALGLDESLTFRNGTLLFNQIQKLLQTNTTEIVKICNQRTQFYQCLGSSYYPCMSMFNVLSKPNPDFQNGFDYTRAYMGLEFMCNAGFETVINDWYCLHGIQTLNSYQNCMNNFNSTVNPNTVCGAVTTTGQCLNDVYKTACGDPGAGFFGCENFRFTFDQVCYGLRCVVG